MVSTDPATLSKVRRVIDEHGVEGAHVILRDSLLRGGASRDTAESVSARDIARAQQQPSSPADLSDGMAGAPQTPVGDDSGLAAGDGSRDWSGWQPGMPLPKASSGGMRPGESTPPAGYTVPGPRTLDGQPVRAPQPLASDDDVAAYNTRPKDSEGPFYLPSQRDSDMIRRGMVPVFNPDGTIGYSVLYPKDEATEGPQLPGAAGRLGLRPDLEAKGWVPTTADSPLGTVNVYRPGAEAQKRYDAQAEARTKNRLADRLGLGVEAEGMTLDTLRAQNRAKTRTDRAARNEAWRAQTMLAGGQPTGGRGGSKAVTNALMMLPKDERNQSLQYMLPGGQLAASVDANANQQAFELAKQMALGAGFQDPNSPAAQAALQALEAKRRKENPEAAGVSDLASGNPTSTEAQAEADRLALSMDNDWGGFSYEAEMALAQRLQQPPYNMKQPDAEAAAHRAAENRRWWWNQGGSPQRPVTTGNSPAAWGAAPPQGPPGA